MGSSGLAAQIQRLSRTLDPAPFETFREDVILYNRGRNLVSRVHSDEQVDRLIVESVAAALALPVQSSERFLDIGSGAGFPGIPLALVRSESPVDLLERRSSACDFLRRELAVLGLGRVRVLEGQAQEIQKLSGEEPGYNWVTLKAVAPPREALALARPFLEVGGRAVLFRSSDWEPDTELLADGWNWDGAQMLGVFPVPTAGTGLGGSAAESREVAIHLFSSDFAS